MCFSLIVRILLIFIVSLIFNDTLENVRAYGPLSSALAHSETVNLAIFSQDIRGDWEAAADAWRRYCL